MQPYRIHYTVAFLPCTIAVPCNAPCPHMDAQEEFDKKYIAASEIMKTLGVTRGGLLHARRVGKLPAPINVSNGLLFVWLREQVTPILDAWKQELLTRREH